VDRGSTVKLLEERDSHVEAIKDMTLMQLPLHNCDVGRGGGSSPPTILAPMASVLRGKRAFLPLNTSFTTTGVGVHIRL
jgi:hypothetical protein